LFHEIIGTTVADG